MTWDELQELQRNTPEPGPSSSSTSKRGSIGPRGSSPLGFGDGPLTPRSRPRPASSNTMDPTERKMIEAREELSKVALGFRTRLLRSPLGSKSPGTGMNDDETHLLDGSTHPFDDITHPFDTTAHSLDETTRPFDESQVQSQELHPFDDDSYVPSQGTHPFDDDTQQPPDSIVDVQSQRLRLEVGESDIQIGASPAPSTTEGSKRRTEAFLTASILETRNGRHSRSPSHLPPVPPIDRLRLGTLGSPDRPSRSPQNSPTKVAASSLLRRQKVPTPITTLRNSLRSPRSSTEDIPILSPQRARAGGVSPEDGRQKPTVTQKLRELIENSPRTRRAPANVAIQPQTHGEVWSVLKRFALTLSIPERLLDTSERKQSMHRTRFSEPSGRTTKILWNADIERGYIVKPETTTPGRHLKSKSMVDDDPFSSPPGLRLSSPQPPTDATIPDAEQDSPLAPVTTSQNGLEATIKSRKARREAVQDRSRGVHVSERPKSTTSLKSTTLRKGKGVVGAPVPIERDEDEDAMDESQTYDVERDLYDAAGTPMMDLSFRPPRRIPPTYRTSTSHTHHRTSSSTADSRDRERERDRDGRKSLSSYRERGVHPDGDVEDNREQRRDPRRLSGVSFGSPIAVSSPPKARRNGRGQSYDRSITSSSKTSLGDSSSTLSPTVGIMTGPLGLGFAPSEVDAYLGIQAACEKLAKVHGFQSDAVFRVYQEVKDLRKVEEIVIGMKRAAEKDAIERILKVKEKTERRMNEKSVESSTYWDRDGGQSRTSRRSHDVRDEGEDDDDQDTDNRIIYEEDEDDQDSPLRVEHLSHRDKRSSAPSTSALRHRGGYERPRISATTTRTRERDQVREREGSMEYHPPTPTRANLWERLSKSGRHPDTAHMGESLRASLSMPRYDVVDHE